MNTVLNPVCVSIVIKLFLAIILGMAIGVERVLAHKTAGMRTYALVTMGSALFIIISEMMTSMYSYLPGFNPTLLASAVISAVGFLGAGIMLWRDKTLVGLTSAAGMWVCAGIGIAIGYGFYFLGIIATVAVLFIFVILWFVEQKIKHITLRALDDGNPTLSETDK